MAVRSVEREMNGGTAIKEADKLNLIDISDFVTKSKMCVFHIPDYKIIEDFSLLEIYSFSCSVT